MRHPGMPQLDGYLYRYDVSRYSEHSLMLNLYRFPIRKETACGAQIDVWGRQRFVNLLARKRYACPTEAEALESFRARKQRQIRILKYQLAEAEMAARLEAPGEHCYVDEFTA